MEVVEILSRSGISVCWKRNGRSRNSDTKSSSASSSTQEGCFGFGFCVLDCLGPCSVSWAFLGVLLVSASWDLLVLFLGEADLIRFKLFLVKEAEPFVEFEDLELEVELSLMVAVALSFLGLMAEVELSFLSLVLDVELSFLSSTPFVDFTVLVGFEGLIVVLVRFLADWLLLGLSNLVSFFGERPSMCLLVADLVLF